MSNRTTVVVAAIVVLVLLGCCAAAALTALASGVTLAGLAVGGQPAAPGWVRSSISTSTQLQVGDRPVVEVVGVVGDVAVSAGSTGVVSVQAEMRARGRSSEGAQALLAETTVSASETDEGALITVSMPEDSDSRGGVEVDLTVTVPTGTTLRVETRVGSVSAKGTAGAADLRTGVGDVVWVGGVTAETAVTLTTGVGDVRFEAPSDSSFQLDAATSVGAVTCGFSLAETEEVEPGVAGAALKGRYGDEPRVDVTIRSEVGDIVLSPLATPGERSG